MRRQQLQRAGDIVLASLMLVAGWQALSLVIGARYLPAPWQTAARIAAAFGQAAFLGDLGATGQAYAIALAIATAAGVVLGLLSGGWRAAGEMVEPLMHTIVALPKVTLYPVILLLFGLGDAAKIAFGVLHGLPTVT
ncbi:MAG: ABC transporter permease, partial [Alphaproteobacteria bacterium]|nr:ABC transporter permease [Alphaproteobacteria bacterium]